MLEASVSDLINPIQTARFGDTMRESTQRKTFRDTFQTLKSFGQTKKKESAEESSWIVRP